MAAFATTIWIDCYCLPNSLLSIDALFAISISNTFTILKKQQNNIY